MTTRERWIVYPLLFLTLGITMRDKFVPPDRLDAQEVHCNRLIAREVTCRRTVKCGQLEATNTRSHSVVVTEPKGQERVRIGVMPNGAGQIELRGKDDGMAAVMGTDRTGEAGLIGTYTVAGEQERPLVFLAPYEESGAVVTFDRNANVILIGRNGPELGVFGWMPGWRRLGLLTRPWRPEFWSPPLALPQDSPAEPDPGSSEDSGDDGD